MHARMLCIAIALWLPRYRHTRARRDKAAATATMRYEVTAVGRYAEFCITSNSGRTAEVTSARNRRPALPQHSSDPASCQRHHRLAHPLNILASPWRYARVELSA